MANTLTVDQIYPIVNDIVSQATGRTDLQGLALDELITVGRTGLLTGYDPYLNAISQVLTRTFMRNRPYTRHLKGINVSMEKYGNHTRKLQTVDREFEANEYLPLNDGDSIDHYKIKKPIILQTNHYGTQTFGDHLTIHETQLDVAFTGPRELSEFLSMILQNISDRQEHAHENLSRALLSNAIAGKAASYSRFPDGVVYMLDEYENETGVSLTPSTVMHPDNWKDFIDWAYSLLKTTADFMSQRSVKYQFQVTGKPITHHTPARNLKMYISSMYLNSISTRALNNTFSPEFMKLVDHESIAYWQSINSPTSINVKPVFIDAAGEPATTTDPIEINNIFGFMFDEEMLGQTSRHNAVKTTPQNAAGSYHNIYWKIASYYWCDFIEKGVVFIMDKAPTTPPAISPASSMKIDNIVKKSK